MKVRIYRNYELNNHNYFQEVDDSSLKHGFMSGRYGKFFTEAIDAVRIKAPKEEWTRDDLDIEEYSASPMRELTHEELEDVDHIRINLNMGSGEDIAVHPEWDSNKSFVDNLKDIDLSDTDWESPYIISPYGHWVEVSYVTKNK